MTTSTKELIDRLTKISRVETDLYYLTAQRLKELQEELDEYCPRPVNGHNDHSSAGCIKRGECGCHIGCEIGRVSQ